MKNIDLGSIVGLHIWSCNSIDSTILEFSGAILIFWLVLTYWLDWLMHQKHNNSVECLLLEGVDWFLGATTNVSLGVYRM